jgi:hypothetical protein
MSRPMPSALRRCPLSLLVLLSLGTAAAVADDARTLRDVPYFDMRGGFCTPTVLRMNFEFHGAKVPATVIQNWSWNYGFHLNDRKRIAFPTTDPVEQIAHAAGIMGYEATTYTHDSAAEATARVKALVDDGIPAIVQWIPHSVLAVGYSGDRLLIHDPHDQLAPEQGKMFGNGAFHESQPGTWSRPPALWNVRRYLVIALLPTADAVPDYDAIDWSPILKRNAARTLGGRQGPDSFGVVALRDLADQPRGDLPLTGYYGWTARQNAAVFLRSHGDANLRQAGDHFSRSAELFRKVYTHEGDVRDHLSRIADEEEQAAHWLTEAADTVR